MIPYGRQQVDEQDKQAVLDVLNSDFLTQGPMVPAFEKALCERVGAEFSVAMNSATSALHAACLALEVGPGDRVWTSAISFVASANCAIYCGAEVDFVDVDPISANMSLEALRTMLETGKQQGCLPKVLIPVHMAGQPVDMSQIAALSKKYNFKVIEDASHALGAEYDGERVGSCLYSDVTVFSFHPVKMITTGEGGAAMTNSPDLYRALQRIRSHGITRDPMEMEAPYEGGWMYDQVTLGFNYRMTELQAALGFSQITRLDHYVARRHELAERYDRLLADLPITGPWQHPDSYSGLHLYVIRLKLDHISKTHREVFDALREQGIGVNLHYIPVHTHPFYKRMGFKSGDYPQAEQYYAEAISLPIFATITERQQGTVIDGLSLILR